MEMLMMCRCVEAPIQLVTLLYLMLRGILTLPWSEPLSASCVEDSLGRQEATILHSSKKVSPQKFIFCSTFICLYLPIKSICKTCLVWKRLFNVAFDKGIFV